MKRIIEAFKEKWPNYILEVCVIVIGILVAFTLNTWNEDRKTEIRKKSILQKIKIDLLEDIERHQVNSALYQQKIEKSLLIFDGKMPVDSLFKQHQLVGIRLIRVQDKSFNQFKSSSDFDPFKQDSLFTYIDDYYNYATIGQLFLNEAMAKLAIENLNLLYTYEWSAELGVNRAITTPRNKEAFRTFIDSQTYQNQLAKNYRVFENFRGNILILLEQSRFLVSEIDRLEGQ